MRALVGVGDPAGKLRRMVRRSAQEAEHRNRPACAAGHSVPGLREALGVVNAAAVEARRRSGLESALRQLELLEPRRQALRRRVAGAAGGVIGHANMDAAVEKCAGGQHHRSAAKADADLRHGSHDPIALDHQVVNRLLEDPEMGLTLYAPADRRLVQNAVGLRAGRTHRRPLARIKDAKLNAALVGRLRHRAAQRVDLLDQMALADAANGRVATHLPQRLDVVREQQRPAAHARSRERGLGTGVAAADHDDVEFLWIKHGWGWVGAGSAGTRRPRCKGQRRFYRERLRPRQADPTGGRKRAKPMAPRVGHALGTMAECKRPSTPRIETPRKL